jgi:hypothetical protein
VRGAQSRRGLTDAPKGVRLLCVPLAWRQQQSHRWPARGCACAVASSPEQYPGRARPEGRDDRGGAPSAIERAITPATPPSTASQPGRTRRRKTVTESTRKQTVDSSTRDRRSSKNHSGSSQHHAERDTDRDEAVAGLDEASSRGAGRVERW